MKKLSFKEMLQPNPSKFDPATLKVDDLIWVNSRSHLLTEQYSDESASPIHGKRLFKMKAFISG